MDLKEVKNVHPYMDDIITGDKSPHKHLKTLDVLLFCLDICRYKLKLTKCQFMHKAVDFMGWTVTPEGVHQQIKTRWCQKTHQANNAQWCEKPFGLHVPYYSNVVCIIQLLLSKKGLKGDLSIERFWKASHNKALETLKQILLQNQVLSYPDILKPFILYTDASKYNMSAVLMQYDNKGQLVPLGYWSK